MTATNSHSAWLCNSNKIFHQLEVWFHTINKYSPNLKRIPLSQWVLKCYQLDLYRTLRTLV